MAFNNVQKGIAQRMASDLIAAIERGDSAPWVKPWNAGNDRFCNVQSGHVYKGWNPFWLGMYNLVHGYTQPYFVTCNALFKAAKAKGVRVNIDDPKRITSVMWFSKITKEIENKDGEKEERSFWAFQAFNVYNIQQVENWRDFFADDLAKFDVAEERENEEIPVASNFYSAYLNSQGLEIKPATYAAYSPSGDYINMPDITTFVSSNSYYGTLGHECVHSTGHKDRKNRFETFGRPCRFGDANYSAEELVAEFGASMLGQMLGTHTEFEHQQGTAYLMGWAKSIKNDPEIILKAAIEAHKAVNFMISKANE